MRTTIDFGIDLGTTNSAIAHLNGISTEIIKNSEQQDLTPSAVFINPKGNLSVGLQAKAKLGRGDVAIEFKRNMGTRIEQKFPKANRLMKPEELSAEVLKSLKEDVKVRFNEDLKASVITVPAIFEMPQSEATQKAARLAGLEICPLLQEPVAASLAYGFQGKEDEREVWLVYDFGGGTFDAALMQIRDGIIQVLAHEGDNQLGGSLIDKAIVDSILIPKLLKEFNLPEFNRGNERWISKMAILKEKAEAAKIRLSRNFKVDLTVDDLGQDADGQEIYLEFEITQQEITKLAEPYIKRSILKCRELLKKRNLDRDDISKVLLVGGPTFAPYFRERLSDKNEGLGIQLDFSQDPMTVVARGAAIFAGTQRLNKSVAKPSLADTFAVQLEYEPIGLDTNPIVVGKVIPANEVTLNEYSIEFVNELSQPVWRSGKMPLKSNGSFVAELFAQREVRNEYKISLFDKFGTSKPIEPNVITYTVGSTPDQQLLLNDISIALKNNATDLIFSQGTKLPSRKRLVRHQYYSVRKEQSEDSIAIPIVEGRNKLADRNKLIGKIEIKSSELKRDLPANSDVEITFDMSESRTIRLEIFIPVLDQEFEKELDISVYQAPDQEKMTSDLQAEQNRLIGLKEKVKETSNVEANNLFQEIEEVKSIDNITNALKNGGEQDRLDAFNQLLEVRQKLDNIEESLIESGLESEIEEAVELTKEIIFEQGDSNDRAVFEILCREIDIAINSEVRNIPLIQEKIESLTSLRYRVMLRRPEWWAGYFEYLEQKSDEYQDQALAKRLLENGRKNIDDGDLKNIQNICRQLLNLLSDEERKLSEAHGSTIFRN